MPVYLIGWIVLGIGTGLYDAAFAALTRMYGHDARAAITNLTLLGGFSGTVCWPLSALLADHYGWRGTCLIYAILHLAVALPLQLHALRTPQELVTTPSAGHAVDEGTGARRERMLLGLIAAILTLAAGIGLVVVVHLMTFLQGRGADFAGAVMLGTLFGPA